MKVGPGLKMFVACSLVLAAVSVIWVTWPTGRGSSAGDRWGGRYEATAETLAFFDAVASGDVATVRAALAANPTMATERVWRIGTPLQVAAMQDQRAMAEFLIQHGADPNHPGRWGGTPLHWASWTGRSDMVQLLLERGASVELRCRAHEATPLLWAAHGSGAGVNDAGDYDAVCKLLLDAGATADTANGGGIPAVAMASDSVRNLLLARGAKPWIPPEEPAPATAAAPDDPTDDVPYPQPLQAISTPRVR